MPTGTGLDAQVGFVKESTYGTFLAPTAFYPFTSEDLGLEKTYIRSQGIRTGRYFQSQSLHKATTRQGSGSLVMELLNKGFGKFFDLLHGNSVTPVQQGATTAYLQTHNVGLTEPKASASVQVGKPSTSGTVNPHSYIGCVLMGMTIAVESGGLATVTMNWDVRDESTAQTLGTASYASGAVPFDFTEGVVKVGGSNIANVRSVTLNIEIPRAVDRFHVGNSGVKDKPLLNGFVAVTADAELEFASLTDHDRFKNETVATLALEFTGDVIEGAYNYEANFALAATKQVTSRPTVSGPGIITSSASFEGLDTGAATPLVVEYLSTDTTV